MMEVLAVILHPIRLCSAGAWWSFSQDGITPLEGIQLVAGPARTPDEYRSLWEAV